MIPKDRICPNCGDKRIAFCTICELCDACCSVGAGPKRTPIALADHIKEVEERQFLASREKEQS